jgi:uncharacterized membrane protein HdeD (DUF308 family)
VADGQHLMTDVVSSVGVLIGVGLALATGWLWLDPAMAVLVAISHRGAPGWVWGLLNGLVTLVLGGLILSMKLAGQLSVLGILVGVSFLFSGVDLLAFGASFHPEED